MKRFLLMALILTELFCVQSFRVSAPLPLLQCQSYPGDDNIEQVHIPNIPDQNFDQQNISDLKTDEGATLVPTGEDLTLIFTYPPVSGGRSCSGRILTIEFCYQIPARLADELINVFNFLILARNDSEFRVTDRLRVRSMPTDAICTNSTATLSTNALEDTLICCDREMVGNRREFLIGLSSFTFAFMNRNEARMLAFDATETEYHLEQLQTPLQGAGPPGSTFSVSEASLLNNQSAPLFRFSLEPDNLATTPDCITTTATTDQVELNLMSDDSPDTSDTGEAINSTKNTIIVAALSGVVGVLALLTVLLLLVIVLQIKNMRNLDRGSSMKPPTTLSSIPSHSQESLTRYEFQAVTSPAEDNMDNATPSVN